MGLTGSKTVTHDLVVSTGDKKGAGVVNATVVLVFTDTDGKVSSEISLVDHHDNDFKQGKEVTIGLDLGELTKISEIRIRRDDLDNEDDWYILKLVVNQKNESGDVISSSIFPLTRWLHGGDDMSFSEYDSSLPQFDKYSEQRAKELVKMRYDYLLAEKILGAPPLVEIIPKDQEFTTKYFLSIGADLLLIAGQSFITNRKTEEFKSLEDIEALYAGPIPAPKGLLNWKSDEEFGNQRVAGVNPALIEICTEIPSHMREIIDNPNILEKNLLEGLTIQQAIQQKKLYKVDLRYLKDIPCNTGLVLPGPTCLLFSKSSGDLVPIAIQIMPEPAEDNPVFTPNDPEYTWLAAKMWFNFGDASNHQSTSHLGMTHLLMDAVGNITNRQLSQSHPMYRLLAPHLLYIMAINDLATKALVQPDGFVDSVMTIGRVGMFNIIRRDWAQWNIQKDGNIRKLFERKGTMDLPNYYYREDSLLLWDAIESYVREVVNGVYDTPEKLAGDFEVHNWLHELKDSAKFNGIEEVTTNEQLVEIITVFIFNSSVQHAAVNFGQYDEYGFPPNYPAIINMERPKTHEALTEEYVVKSLPNKDQTLGMIRIVKILSERGTKELGNFEIQYGYDPISVNALQKFQAELMNIQRIIQEKNRTRSKRYDILLPSDVPNAISI